MSPVKTNTEQTSEKTQRGKNAQPLNFDDEASVRCASGPIRQTIAPKPETQPSILRCPSRHFSFPPVLPQVTFLTSAPSWLDRKQTMSLKMLHPPRGLGRNVKCPEICHLMWQGHFNTWHRKKRGLRPKKSFCTVGHAVSFTSKCSSVAFFFFFSLSQGNEFKSSL